MFRNMAISIVCVCFIVVTLEPCKSVSTPAVANFIPDEVAIYCASKASHAFSPMSYSETLKNNGILGRYCLKSLGDVRQRVRSFLSNPVPTDSLVGFCKAHFVLSSLWENCWSLRPDPSKLNEQLYFIWQKGTKDILSNAEGATEEQARKLAFVTVVDTTWAECVGACRSVATEGSFSHKYSLEDALMILHMYPQIGFFEKFWIPSEDMEFYTNCVAGALNSLMDIPEACALFNRREPYPSADIFTGTSPTQDQKTFRDTVRFNITERYIQGVPYEAVKH